PLERNAFVRTRLTHSMEVQQVGRHIFKEIIYRLQSSARSTHYGFTPVTIAAFETITEMACLMHDIGNPPFGHFGEAAINHWFARRIAIWSSKATLITAEQDNCVFSALKMTANKPLDELKLAMRQ